VRAIFGCLLTYGDSCAVVHAVARRSGEAGRRGADTARGTGAAGGWTMMVMVVVVVVVMMMMMMMMI
jgi:hypothetical protein